MPQDAAGSAGAGGVVGAGGRPPDAPTGVMRVALRAVGAHPDTLTVAGGASDAVGIACHTIGLEVNKLSLGPPSIRNCPPCQLSPASEGMFFASDTL